MQVGDVFNPYKFFIGVFVPNCLLHYRGLSASAKLCWARLAQYAGKDGRCFARQEKLADELGLSTRQVRRLTKELEAQGFIRVSRPTGQDRLLHKPASYQFLGHAIFEEVAQEQDGVCGQGTGASSAGWTATTSPIEENHQDNHGEEGEDTHQHDTRR